MKLSGPVRDNEFECPECEETTPLQDGFEYTEGCDHECPKCGVTSVVTEEDFTRYLSWQSSRTTPGGTGEKEGS
jgi:hypothetical protein